MWLSFFEWCEATVLGTAVRNSLWAFPVIEATHLLGLCLLGGAILIVDLRLLGAGLKNQRIADIARYGRPFLISSIVILLVTGVPLFLSEAVKCYYSTSFWVKMAALPIALVFTFTVRDRLAHDDTLETSFQSRVLGASSLAVWFVVAAAGRWVGFS